MKVLTTGQFGLVHLSTQYQNSLLCFCYLQSSELSRVDDLENLEIVLLKSFEISELFDGVLNCKINSLFIIEPKLVLCKMNAIELIMNVPEIAKK